MPTIIFQIPGPPVPKGRHRFAGKGRVYTPPRTTKAEARVAHAARKHAPAELPTGPVALRLVFEFGIPKSKRARGLEGAPVVVCPDLDNLVKLVKDGLNRVLWVDDSQVYRCTAEKVYGDETRTLVEVEY